MDSYHGKSHAVLQEGKTFGRVRCGFQSMYVVARVAIQRLDPNGDPTQNPTRTGQVGSGQAFYGPGFFGSGLLASRNSGFFRVNPRKS